MRLHVSRLCFWINLVWFSLRLLESRASSMHFDWSWLPKFRWEHPSFFNKLRLRMCLTRLRYRIQLVWLSLWVLRTNSSSRTRLHFGPRIMLTVWRKLCLCLFNLRMCLCWKSLSWRLRLEWVGLRMLISLSISLPRMQLDTVWLQRFGWALHYFLWRLCVQLHGTKMFRRINLEWRGLQVRMWRNTSWLRRYGS